MRRRVLIVELLQKTTGSTREQNLPFEYKHIQRSKNNGRVQLTNLSVYTKRVAKNHKLKLDKSSRCEGSWSGSEMMGWAC